MILDDRDKQNLIDALKEWEECVGCKELSEEDVGLNHDRYVNLMRRLGVTGDIENNLSWGMTDDERREELKSLGYPRGKEVEDEVLIKARKWDEHVRNLAEHGGV